MGVRQVAVGLRFRPGAELQPDPTSGIDLHRVRAMMEEMGTTLSPGAQNLMEMVQFQQKVSTGRFSLGVLRFILRSFTFSSVDV